MKHKANFSIDTFTVKQLNDEGIVDVTGWIITPDLTKPVLVLEINDKEVPFEISWFMRGDALKLNDISTEDYQAGFHLRSRIEGSVISVSLYEKTMGNLLKKGSWLVGRKTETHPFYYDLRAQKAGDQQEFMNITGSVMDPDDHEIEVRIVNALDKEIPAEIKREERKLLVEQGYSNSKLKPGFNIMYPREGNETAFIEFSIGDQKIKKQIYETKDLAKARGPKVNFLINNLNPVRLVNAYKYLNQHGWKKFIQKAEYEVERISRFEDHPGQFSPHQYHEWFLRHQPSESELELQRNTEFNFSPKISVIVAAYNTPIRFLKEMIASLENQTYKNWELCIADGSTEDDVENYIRQTYAGNKKFQYKRLGKNLGISGNQNEALDMTTGDYIGFFDHDDLLTPNALFEIVKSIQDVRHDMIYTDEDKLNNGTGEFEDPHFKADFSLETLRSHNYITHFLVISRNLFDKVGYFRDEYNGSQDYDFILRCSEQAESIYHVPMVLYHWRMHASSTAQDPKSKLYCFTAGQKAIQDHLARCGIKGEVKMFPAPYYGFYHVHYDILNDPLVSIIIPNKDHVDDLSKCLNSIKELNTYKNIEIIIAENNSTDPETFNYYKKIQMDDANIRVVTWEHEFNYSLINNFAAEHAKGDIFLFLNNDTELIFPDSIREMVMLAQNPEIGVVGAKLLYPDRTIQHAGVVLGHKGYAAHAWLGYTDWDSGVGNRINVVTNYSAVTGACLMVKRSDFEAVEGFDGRFRVAVNDVDFCLKVRELGRRNVYTPFSKWYHYESKSRGSDIEGGISERFQQEIKMYQEKWPNIWNQPDPFHNINYSVDIAPFYLDVDH